MSFVKVVIGYILGTHGWEAAVDYAKMLGSTEREAVKRVKDVYVESQEGKQNEHKATSRYKEVKHG